MAFVESNPKALSNLEKYLAHGVAPCAEVHKLQQWFSEKGFATTNIFNLFLTHHVVRQNGNREVEDACKMYTVWGVPMDEMTYQLIHTYERSFDRRLYSRIGRADYVQFFLELPNKQPRGHDLTVYLGQLIVYNTMMSRVEEKHVDILNKVLVAFNNLSTEARQTTVRETIRWALAIDAYDVALDWYLRAMQQHIEISVIPMIAYHAGRGETKNQVFWESIHGAAVTPAVLSAMSLEGLDPLLQMLRVNYEAPAMSTRDESFKAAIASHSADQILKDIQSQYFPINGSQTVPAGQMLIEAADILYEALSGSYIELVQALPKYVAPIFFAPCFLSPFLRNDIASGLSTLKRLDIPNAHRTRSINDIFIGLINAQQWHLVESILMTRKSMPTNKTKLWLYGSTLDAIGNYIANNPSIDIEATFKLLPECKTIHSTPLSNCRIAHFLSTGNLEKANAIFKAIKDKDTTTYRHSASIFIGLHQNSDTKDTKLSLHDLDKFLGIERMDGVAKNDIGQDAYAEIFKVLMSTGNEQVIRDYYYVVITELTLQRSSRFNYEYIYMIMKSLDSASMRIQFFKGLVDMKKVIGVSREVYDLVMTDNAIINDGHVGRVINQIPMQTDSAYTKKDENCRSELIALTKRRFDSMAHGDHPQQLMNRAAEMEKILVLQDYIRLPTTTQEMAVAEIEAYLFDESIRFKRLSESEIMLRWLVDQDRATTELINVFVAYYTTVKDDERLTGAISAFQHVGATPNAYTIDVLYRYWVIRKRSFSLCTLSRIDLIQPIIKRDLESGLDHETIMIHISKIVPWTFANLIVYNELAGCTSILALCQRTLVEMAANTAVQRSFADRVADYVLATYLDLGMDHRALTWLSWRILTLKMVPTHRCLRLFSRDKDNYEYWRQMTKSLPADAGNVRPAFVKNHDPMVSAMAASIVPPPIDDTLVQLLKDTTTVAPVIEHLAAKYFSTNKMPSSRLFIQAIMRIRNELSDSAYLTKFVPQVPALFRPFFVSPAMFSKCFQNDLEGTVIATLGNNETFLFANNPRTWNDIVIGLLNADRFDLVQQMTIALTNPRIVEDSTVERIIQHVLENDIDPTPVLQWLPGVNRPHHLTSVAVANCRISAAIRQNRQQEAYLILQSLTPQVSDAMTYQLGAQLFCQVHQGRITSRVFLLELEPFLGISNGKHHTHQSIYAAIFKELLKNGRLDPELVHDYITRESAQLPLVPINPELMEVLLSALSTPIKRVSLFAQCSHPSTLYSKSALNMVTIANHIVGNPVVSKTLTRCLLAPTNTVIEKPKIHLSQRATGLIRTYFIENNIHTQNK
eukprot:gene3427-3892_t